MAPPPQGPAEGDPDRFCSICHASFNNPTMAKQHYVGKKHKKQLTKMKLLETYGPSSTPGETSSASPPSTSPHSSSTPGETSSPPSTSPHSAPGQRSAPVMSPPPARPV